MSPKLEYLVNSIFKKLKNYKVKKIYLEEKNLNEFITSLFIESRIEDLKKNVIIDMFKMLKCIIFLY